jgi:hypothetical protein
VDKDLFTYFIDETNKRFDRVEKKLDQLISFRLMLLGGAAVISAIISLIASVYIH